MKNGLRLAAILLFLMSILTGCSSNVGNKITLRNMASSKIYFNFRATIIEVDAGATSVITETPRGTFAYGTTYETPAGATSSTTNGNASGELTLNAGTQVLIAYSSTFSDGSYTLVVTVTTDEDLSDTGGVTDPLNP